MCTHRTGVYQRCCLPEDGVLLYAAIVHTHPLVRHADAEYAGFQDFIHASRRRQSVSPIRFDANRVGRFDKRGPCTVGVVCAGQTADGFVEHLCTEGSIGRIAGRI